MSKKQTTHIEKELKHGLWLKNNDAEKQWGWGTPAGRLRAKRRASVILEGARIRTGMHILEIGCGTGLFTELFIEHDVHITAIDLSPDLISSAKARGLPAAAVTFEVVPFECLATRSSFDAVVGSSILHHLEMPRALHLILDLLVPGGWMSFAEPNMLNPQVFLMKRFPSLFPRETAEETAFVRYRLEKEIIDSGFQDVTVRPFDWLHPATSPAFIPLVQRLGLALESIPVLREFSGSLALCGQRPST